LFDFSILSLFYHKNTILSTDIALHRNGEAFRVDFYEILQIIQIELL